MRFILLAATALLCSGCLSIHVHPPASASVGGHAAGADANAPMREALRETEQRLNAQRVEMLNALAQTNVAIAAEVQRWVEKPAAFGGGNGAFGGVTFEALGYRVAHDGTFTTMDGSFTLEASDQQARVVGEHFPLGLRVVTVVVGRALEDIMTTVEPL